MCKHTHMAEVGQPDCSILGTPQPKHRKKKKTYKFSTRKAIARAVERKKEGQAWKTLRAGVPESDIAIKKLDFTRGTLDDDEPQVLSEGNGDNQKASSAFNVSIYFPVLGQT